MIISNTRVSMFNTCERQEYYRFRLDIQPKYTLQSISLTRGTVFHKVLDYYFSAIKNGESRETAIKAGLEAHTEETRKIAAKYPTEVDLIKEIARIRSLFEEYVAHYEEDPFNIIESEKTYIIPVAEDIRFAMQLDNLVQFTKGAYRGDYAVMDHKVVYNFKSQAELDMNVQIPKYVHAVSIATGMFITKGFFDQIRYRADAKGSRFQRTEPQKATKSEISRIWDEQQRSAEEIYSLHKLPLEWHEKSVKRVTNDMICKHCPFAIVCKKDLKGESISREIEMSFEKNTYGYEGNDNGR